MAGLGGAVLLAAVGLAAGGGPAAADTGPNYVSLGDSYTAGPLIPDQTGHPALCLRSTHNYPSLVAKSVGAATFTDASCSGSTTDDMTSAQNLGISSNPPEFDSLKADTTLVTVGIGGNDIGFGSIILTCGSLSVTNPAGAPCEKKYTSGGTDQLQAKIDATGPKIAAMLDGIHARSPHARVIVVGYPRVLPASGKGCWPVVPIAAGDVPYLSGVEKSLNAMLEKRAHDGGASYAVNFTAGHDLCQAPADKWVEGIIPTMPAAPVHPNANGMRATAGAVEQAVSSTSSER
ncbi:MAG TPA: SGNH/GDSL hydrolase family protein [Streptosporangiaceae bacterium]|jgi:lysophospholipase L1-like esterase